MVVKKKGKKWHPVGKSGKLWKTGYPTQTAAGKALTQANKYFASMKRKGKSKKKKSGSKSPKKKTKKKGTSKKKKTTGGGRTTKKKTLLTYLRAGIYGITILMPAVQAVGRHGFTAAAAEETGRRYASVNPQGQFSINQAKATYTPILAWATIDTIASKAGVYRRIGGVMS